MDPDVLGTPVAKEHGFAYIDPLMVCSFKGVALEKPIPIRGMNFMLRNKCHDSCTIKHFNVKFVVTEGSKESLGMPTLASYKLSFVEHDLESQDLLMLFSTLQACLNSSVYPCLHHAAAKAALMYSSFSISHAAMICIAPELSCQVVNIVPASPWMSCLSARQRTLDPKFPLSLPPSKWRTANAHYHSWGTNAVRPLEASPCISRGKEAQRDLGRSTLTIGTPMPPDFMRHHSALCALKKHR
eukprot:1150964-Pelagomonas_calceolata.AAC.4